MELLAGGDSDAALHVLSDAVLLDPRSSMALGARALCLVALGRPTHALADADAALAINAHYAKVRRRGARRPLPSCVRVSQPSGRPRRDRARARCAASAQLFECAVHPQKDGLAWRKRWET